VRRALALATNREALAHVAMRGYYLPATGGFVPPGMPGHSAGVGLPHDPSQARQLLAEAGYPGGRGFPALEALTWDAFEAPLVYLEEQWQESLGLEIRGEVVEWEMYLDRREARPPHMCIGAWVADYPDPHSFLCEGLPRSQGSAWRNETFDGMIGRAARMRDQAERMRLYQQGERILAEEVPILPLVYGRWDILLKPWVSRYPLSPTGSWFWKDVVIEPH
jgi:ABC-type transport system substrate-binding protein